MKIYFIEHLFISRYKILLFTFLGLCPLWLNAQINIHVHETSLKLEKYPVWAIKGNLLYGFTMTPNLSMSVGLGNHWSAELGAGLNLWKWKHDHSSLRHLSLTSEARYWPKRVYDGHYIGMHATYTTYHVGHLTALSAFDHRLYDGDLFGGGITYGYHFTIGRKWGLELGLGLGYYRLKYDLYTCAACHTKLKTESKNYVGPTQAAVSFVYYLNGNKKKPAKRNGYGSFATEQGRNCQEMP
ncbi:MAG: DUF3575 domain-containing protein, partial [Prevotellaceae bacterium]|nr:DUF3575 domain-containing protein [Prevotellaceae bacterium]